jgi:4-amino-4-deoxy-L-arabinose transferase-like glycosyltransferase
MCAGSDVTSAVKKAELSPSMATRMSRFAPVLLPLIILIGTGLRGLDFGLHWDERPWQIGPVKTMVESHTLLPGYYNYPSFDYWLNLLVLAPDIATPRIDGENLKQHLVRTLDSHAYLMRLRAVYLVITSLTVIWVYLLVLQHRRSWLEALFAASVVACSWEVAYHLRWVATDGMLMQFAALSVLLAAQALKSGRQSWLFAAAAVAGLGCGTKYPGGLLILPVALAALFGASGCALWEKMSRLAKVAAIFALVYLLVTPATVFQPRKLAHAVFFEMSHYAIGHGGHVIGRGFEHAWRMLTYFATIAFSPYLPVALAIFALVIIGVVSLMRQNWREGIVLLGFPLFYLLYFSVQRAMVVRNLLAVMPFFGIAAARGACMIGEFLGGNQEASGVQLHRTPLWRLAWAGLLGVALCLNASWLILSAESIVARHTDRFVREAAHYVRERSDTKFLLSPRLAQEVTMVSSPLANLTSDPGQADIFLLYAREGMRRWHDWPANRRDLTEACFGPREVNINMYPNWWGDDHIVVINRYQAEAISLHIAGISQDPVAVPATVLKQAAIQPVGSPAATSAHSLPNSWWLPGVDPRILVPRADADSIRDLIARGPASGGWELDGKASTYLTRDGLVISSAFISTSAFNLELHDPGSAIISDVGANAYVAKPGPFGDIRLFARSFGNAVVIHISGQAEPREKKLNLAKEFARIALDHLDNAEDPTRPDELRRSTAVETVGVSARF